MDVDLSKVQSFETAEAFCAWLAKHHDSEKKVWLKMHKKQSGLLSINWEMAVVEALAWGWIDGIKKAHGDMSWFQRFTPRKPKSAWSKKNRGHAERLIAEGRMQPSGLVHVEAAKADGRWDAAYAGSADMVIPDDFLAELAKNPAAQKTFEGLNKANLFAVYYRLTSAKREETRQKRMADMIEKFARGEALH